MKADSRMDRKPGKELKEERGGGGLNTSTRAASGYSGSIGVSNSIVQMFRRQFHSMDRGVWSDGVHWGRMAQFPLRN